MSMWDEFKTPDDVVNWIALYGEQVIKDALAGDTFALAIVDWFELLKSLEDTPLAGSKMIGILLYKRIEAYQNRPLDKEDGEDEQTGT